MRKESENDVGGGRGSKCIAMHWSKSTASPVCISSISEGGAHCQSVAIFFNYTKHLIL